MRFLKLGILSLAICTLGAIASIVVETARWWDIDAQTSWTLVLVLGALIAVFYGGWLARRPFCLGEVLLATGVLSVAMALPLLVGFGLKGAGVHIPWRLPEFEGRLWINVVFSWLYLFLLIGMSFSIARLVLSFFHRPKHVPEPGPGSETPSNN